MNETKLHSKLATRFSRFFASLIDVIIIVIPIAIIMSFTGVPEHIANGTQPSYVYLTIMGLVGVLFFYMFNIKFLFTNGQTVGKKFFRIKIVNLNDNMPTKISLLNRYLVYFGLGFIPIIGNWISIINVLLIFTKNKQCGHDFIVKTKVIKC